MSVTCSNCGAAVQLTDSLNHHQQLQLPNDPLIPFVRAQIDELTAKNSTLVAENDSLASKLIESTEGRMDLDQQLNIAQMELQAVQTELETLKENQKQYELQSELETLRENQKHYEQLISMISSGQLIEKKDVQPVIENLAYESQRRSQIETSKMKLESELEDLSRSLFEEANRMVNEERQLNYLANKKIEGLERQLDEVLDLCKSERDQLVELKLRMAKLSDDKDTIQRERDAIDFAFVQLQQQMQQQQQQQQQHHHSPTSMHHHMSATAAARRGMPIAMSGSPNNSAGTFPSLSIEVAAGSRKHVQQVMQYDAHQYRSSASSVKSKSDSCYFSDEDHPGSHLLNDPNDDRIPSLGFHLWDPAFVEFKIYMEGILGSNKPSEPVKTSQHSATPSVSSIYSFGLMTKTTAPPASSTANAVIPINNLLSNCRLLKKMSSEDVEATLRFDPGNLLSWTQRKRLMTAVTENTLVVESVPMSSSVKDQTNSPVTAHPQEEATSVARPNCALCGNGITTSLYYQYRLTDTANESRTICPYCRTRLTSVCTFYSVLRMISKRIISSATTPEKLYLDFLRIRLSMFLARCGVGIMTGDEAKPKRESTRSQITATPSVITTTVTGALSPRPIDGNNSNNNVSSPKTPTRQVTPGSNVSSPIRDMAPVPVAIITTDIISPVICKSPIAIATPIETEPTIEAKEESKETVAKAFYDDHNEILKSVELPIPINAESA